jgi:phosphate butyryltransferase
MLTSLKDVIGSAVAGRRARVAVVGRIDDRMEECFAEAAELGVAEGVFYVPADGSTSSQTRESVIMCENDEVASYQAVQAVRSGDCDILMKGLVHTDTLLRQVLNKEHGLVSGRLISNVFVYDRPGGGLLLLTDPSINIEPSLEQKAQLIGNAVELAKSLGISRPRVAVLCAVETVNSKMPETVEAAALSKMAERGQIRDCVVDGPLAIDNAISVESAEIKGIGGPVAGKADILVCHRITEANILSKSIPLFSGAELAANVVGTTRPTVVVSRADSAKSRLLSLCLAKLRINAQPSVT